VSELRHGTSTAYKRHGCRCDECRQAQNARNRAQYARLSPEKHEHRKAKMRAYVTSMAWVPTVEVPPVPVRTEGVDDRPTAWKRQAACHGVPTVLFFSEAHEAEAREVCAACPVRDDCRRYGESEEFGLWGGRRAEVA
jgi:WhiB family redox-sensing transcriptional regulator